MKKIGAIVKGKYYSLTDEQKEVLIVWRDLKAQKKKLSKKNPYASLWVRREHSFKQAVIA